MGERVVVTGIGPVTPVGTGLEEFWAGLTTGRNGIRTITAFDTSDLPVTVAGEVPDFDPSPWLDPKEIRRTDRFVHFACPRPRSHGRTRARPRSRPSAPA
jgi:3-oxoacyl-[acyl-carrier-protein] synthase II